MNLDFEISKNNFNMRISYIYKLNLTHSVSLNNTLLSVIFIHHFPEILGMIKTFYKFASQKPHDLTHLNGLIY